MLMLPVVVQTAAPMVVAPVGEVLTATPAVGALEEDPPTTAVAVEVGASHRKDGHDLLNAASNTHCTRH